MELILQLTLVITSHMISHYSITYKLHLKPLYTWDILTNAYIYILYIGFDHIFIVHRNITNPYHLCSCWNLSIPFKEYKGRNSGAFIRAHFSVLFKAFVFFITCFLWAISSQEPPRGLFPLDIIDPKLSSNLLLDLFLGLGFPVCGKAHLYLSCEV